jgi:threonine aldolase
MKISFENDYSESCIPEISDRLRTMSSVQASGYGTDVYSASARRRIAAALQKDEAALQIFFTTGGTLANTAVIAHLLRPHQGVLCAPCAHIFVHESGAIEARGHKVMPVPTDPRSGKLDASGLADYLQAFWADPTREHMAQPGLIYLSNLTEHGAHYTSDELRKIGRVADRYDLPIFMDGARLGSALVAAGETLPFEALPELVDVFTIGGTKAGALFGEAVVFTDRRPERAYGSDFHWILKQSGGRLAKGFLLGMQFDCLFEDRRYLRVAAHANGMADRLREGFVARQVPLWADTAGNQVFVLMTTAQAEQMAKDFIFETWCALGPEEAAAYGLEQPCLCVRLCTSFATTEEQIQRWFETWDLHHKHSQSND